ncbi:unnamed protein product [Cuscuta epithymum]|uniref:Uncharacterized protein n=1 Tax=Cuscuta epithymum TaxID=186058 RepID=A0AAV0DC84_9ASTE|nr:unnamed protein product [Cuscuta epithymum]
MTLWFGPLLLQDPTPLRVPMRKSDLKEVLKTIQGTESPRWTTIANLQAFKEICHYVHFDYSYIRKSCDRAAYFVAANANLITNSPNIYTKFQGILKFDAISYPYVV